MLLDFFLFSPRSRVMSREVDREIVLSAVLDPSIVKLRAAHSDLSSMQQRASLQPLQFEVVGAKRAQRARQGASSQPEQRHQRT